MLLYHHQPHAHTNTTRIKKQERGCVRAHARERERRGGGVNTGLNNCLLPLYRYVAMHFIYISPKISENIPSGQSP